MPRLNAKKGKSGSHGSRKKFLEKEVILHRRKDVGSRKMWWVFVKPKRNKDFIQVAKVYIKKVTKNPKYPPYERRYALINVEVRKGWKGRHIGRWAYKKAAWAGKTRTIYAHFRKSDRTSIAAAKAAGFNRVFPESRGYLMQWNA